MWGLHSTEVAHLLLTQQFQVQFSAFPRIFLLMLLRFIHSTAYNSGHSLDNVNRTHLVLARGKRQRTNVPFQDYMSQYEQLKKLQPEYSDKNGSRVRFLPDHNHLLDRSFTVRFRCLLDNTSGFLVSLSKSSVFYKIFEVWQSWIRKLFLVLYKAQ